MKRRGRWRPPKCPTGKAAYRTQGSALHALDVIARQNAQAVAPLNVRLRNVYRCPKCRAWHLTRQAP